MESMKGMGSYTKVEEELSNYSADEMNELFLSGGLDKMYEDFERENSIGFSNEDIEKFEDDIEDEELEEELEEDGEED